MALCLTVTVCLSILGTLTVWGMREPKDVPDQLKDKMMELVSFILGIVSGYLLRDPQPPPPPPEP
jgi:hypothetical protein